MAAPDVSNILKTGAILYYAAVGEALPDETTVDAGDAWGGNWTRLGYTAAPLTLAYSSDYHEVEVEEVLLPVDRMRISETVQLETELAEVTAAYLDLAMGGGTVSTTAAGASQDAYEEVPLGSVSLLTKYTFGFEGELLDSAGIAQPVRFFVARGTIVMNGNLEFSRKSDDFTTIPVQITALAVDGNEPAGFSSYPYLWQRVTGEKTS